MKHYDFTIIGGGPSGIALAMMLQQTGKSILLIEKEKTLGGCWRIEWEDGKYYTEHSPHIITSSYNRFFKLCKLLDVKNTFEKTYSYHNALLSIYLSNNVRGNLTFSDVIKIISGLIISRFIENTQTVKEFSEHLSERAKKALYIIAVTAATTPDKLMMQDLFDEMQHAPPNIQQLKNPELWIKKAQSFFNAIPNVDLVLNSTVHDIKQYANGEFILNDSIVTKKCILALPPIAICNILKNSTPQIQNNWLPYDQFKQWAYGSYYASIGFQLHFDIDVSYSNDWCWSCIGEWNIIILPMSKYLDTYSKDKSIKTVWSCTLIDQENYSSHLKKKVKECSIKEIEQEVIRQLNIPEPKRITFYDGLHKEKDYYMSKDTGFVRQKFGTMRYEGKLENIHIVSTVNRKGIINMESALQSCHDFVKIHHTGYEKILDTSSYNWSSIIILITFCMILTRKMYLHHMKR